MLLSTGQLFGNAGGGGAPPASPISYIGHSTGAISGGTYTYASAPLTAPAADRLVVVAHVTESVGNNATSGVVVGSTSLTLWSRGRILCQNGIVGYLEIWYGIVATGTAPNIVATTTSVNSSMDVWCISGCSATPVDAVSTTDTNSTSCVLTDVEVKASGALIAVLVAQSAATSISESWTGSDAVVEDSQANISPSTRVCAAHIATTSASTTDDFTFTLSVSKGHVGGAISFGP